MKEQIILKEYENKSRLIPKYWFNNPFQFYLVLIVF